MESKDFKVLNVLMCCFGCFSPDFSPGMPRRRIQSFELLPAIQRNPRVQVKFFWSVHLGPDMEKIKQLLECSNHQNTLGNIGNAVKVLVGTQSTRDNVRHWKKARLTGDVHIQVPFPRLIYLSINKLRIDYTPFFIIALKKCSIAGIEIASFQENT